MTTATRRCLYPLLFAALFGCSVQQAPYDEQPRAESEIAIEQMRLNGRWVYVPTSGAAPRFALNQFPFLQGHARLVELCFSPNGLELRHFDRDYPAQTLQRDARWFCPGEVRATAARDGAQLNFAHVLTIPGRFAEYRCRLDAFDKCTNSEEINTDADRVFTDSTHFSPDFSALRVAELNLAELFGAQSGVSQTDSPRLVDWEVDAAAGVINFELELSFRVDRRHLGSYIRWADKASFADGSADGAFKSRFYFSLVHESLLVDSDYQPIPYSVSDSNRLGLFSVSRRELDPITNHYGRTKRYLSRASSTAGWLDYTLSDSFFAPANAGYRRAVLDALARVNATIDRVAGKDSKIPRIGVRNPERALGVHVGDLRHNVINLVDEHLYNGLAGYGPAVSHPLSGEILRAQVSLYPEVVRRDVPTMWDKLAQLLARGDIALEAGDQDSAAERQAAQLQRRAVAALHARRFSPPDPALLPAPAHAASQPAAQLLEHADDDDLEHILAAETARQRHWSQHNIFPAPAIWVSATQKHLLAELSLDDPAFFDGDPVAGRLKPWSRLPAAQRRVVADAFVRHYLQVTLVHELGHNLGLRHNFHGSNDTANYYDADTAARLGLGRQPAYSSIMDYAASALDDLPTFGPYDIAALRFAYDRSIDLYGPPADSALYAFGQVFAPGPDNPSLVDCRQLEQLGEERARYRCDLHRYDAAARSGANLPLGEGVHDYLARLATITAPAAVNPRLHNYAYCSDGDIALNSDCNRFDEGRNLAEIIDFRWQRYLDNSPLMRAASHRDNGLYQQDYPAYILGRLFEMNAIREVLEEAESIDNALRELAGNVDNVLPLDYLGTITQGQCGDDPDNGESCEKGIAARSAAAFFLDVLATPEHQCIMRHSSGGHIAVSFGEVLNARRAMLPASYDFTRASCFDPAATQALAAQVSGFEPVAETAGGRFLNAIGNVDPDYPYSNALAMLGSWPDKLLAGYFLARRHNVFGNAEATHANLLDWPGAMAAYDNIVRNLLSGEPLLRPPPLINRHGEPFSPPADLQLKLHASEQIEALPSMPAGLSRFFGIGDTKRTAFVEALLQISHRAMQTDDYQSRRRGLLQARHIGKRRNRFDNATAQGLRFEVDGERYLATAENRIAHDLASELLISPGYTLLQHLQNKTPAEVASLGADLNAAWGEFLLSLRAEYRQVVLLLDQALVARMLTRQVEMVASDQLPDAGNEALLASWQQFVDQESASGALVMSADGERLRYRGGPEHATQRVMVAWFYSAQLSYFGWAEEVLGANLRVNAGHAAAAAADKGVWSRDPSALSLYRDGRYERLSGPLHRALRSLPAMD